MRSIEGINMAIVPGCRRSAVPASARQFRSEGFELERFMLSSYKLNDLSAHEVNRRNQHGHRTGMPTLCSSCFSSAIPIGRLRTRALYALLVQVERSFRP